MISQSITTCWRAAGPQRLPDPSIQRLEFTHSSLYQSAVFRCKQAASCLQRISGKAQHPSQRSSSVACYAPNRAVAHRQLPGAAHIVHKQLTGNPCALPSQHTSETTMLPHTKAEAVSSPLTHAELLLCSDSVCALQCW